MRCIKILNLTGTFTTCVLILKNVSTTELSLLSASALFRVLLLLWTLNLHESAVEDRVDSGCISWNKSRKMRSNWKGREKNSWMKGAWEFVLERREFVSVVDFELFHWAVTFTLLYRLRESTKLRYSCLSSKLVISWLVDSIFNNSVTVLFFFFILFCLLSDFFKWAVKYFCMSAWFSCLLCLENKWSLMGQCAPGCTSVGNALFLPHVSEKVPVKYLEEEYSTCKQACWV